MAALIAIIGERNRALRRERVFRDRQNPLEQPADFLIKKYRLPRHEILRLSNELRGDLERETRRNNAVPVELQVCAALRFLASGSFQNVLGDTLSSSQSTLARTISAFTEALVRRVNRYVRLPDEGCRLAKMQHFARVSWFPPCPRCDWRNAHPHKGSETRRTFVCESQKLSQHQCTTRLWRQLYDHGRCCQVAWEQSRFFYLGEFVVVQPVWGGLDSRRLAIR